MGQPITNDAKQTYCEGCRNDFYNHDGHAMNGTHCWSLDEAIVVTRYRLHWWTSPVAPGAYRKVVTLNCWHSPGNWAMHEKPHQEAVGVR